MQRTIACSIAIATLSAVLALSATAAPPITHPRSARPAATAVEPHPEINAAIRSLARAKLHLQRAAHDFGGHRVAAIGAIDAALVQLRLALQYDKN